MVHYRDLSVNKIPSGIRVGLVHKQAGIQKANDIKPSSIQFGGEILSIPVDRAFFETEHKPLQDDIPGLGKKIKGSGFRGQFLNSENDLCQRIRTLPFFQKIEDPFACL